MAFNVEPGDMNRNGQLLLRKTDRRSSDGMQYVWKLRCERSSADGEVCGHYYGADGTDFHERKCPVCQDGEGGISDPLRVDGKPKRLCDVGSCSQGRSDRYGREQGEFEPVPEKKLLR